MKRNSLSIHSVSKFIIWILLITLLILTIHTICLGIKLKSKTAPPTNSIKVSPDINEQFKPTFNKTINYLGQDISMSLYLPSSTKKIILYEK